MHIVAGHWLAVKRLRSCFKVHQPIQCVDMFWSWHPLQREVTFQSHCETEGVCRAVAYIFKQPTHKCLHFCTETHSHMLTNHYYGSAIYYYNQHSKSYSIRVQYLKTVTSHINSNISSTCIYIHILKTTVWENSDTWRQLGVWFKIPALPACWVVLATPRRDIQLHLAVCTNSMGDKTSSIFPFL